MCAMEQRFAYAVFERLKMMVNLMGTKGINCKSTLANRFKVCFGANFVGPLLTQQAQGCGRAQLGARERAHQEPARRAAASTPNCARSSMAEAVRV
jgi:hypothetical protein